MKIGFHDIYAKDLLERTGESLVGMKVLTSALGGWAIVTEIAPDPAAPEIIFNVKSEDGETGILENELIEFAQ